MLSFPNLPSQGVQDKTSTFSEQVKLSVFHKLSGTEAFDDIV